MEDLKTFIGVKMIQAKPMNHYQFLSKIKNVNDAVIAMQVYGPENLAADFHTEGEDEKQKEGVSSKGDRVGHPSHYTSHPSGVECIDITRHYCFDIGNAIKYLWRAGLKKEEGISNRDKEIEDLEKAIWYIKDRIESLRKQNK